MDLGLEKIWFHDSVIHRVIENTETKELGFEVDYPVDWDNNRFAPRTIVFTNVSGYAIEEGPFDGRVTILKVHQTADHKVQIETNAGYRVLSCENVEIRDRWGCT